MPILSIVRIFDNVAARKGIHPSPEKHKKKPALPWTTFVQAHIESMVACDFFTKTVFTARGPLTAYVLIFTNTRSPPLTMISYRAFAHPKKSRYRTL